MKSKKSLLIISVIVALATVLAAFSGITAFAAPTEYEAKTGDIYERAAVKVPVDYVVDKNTGKAVASSDITEVKVTSEDESVTYESGVKKEGKGYIYSSGKIEYYYSENLDKGTGEDKYKVTVTVKNGEETPSYTVTVTVVGKDKVAENGALKYNDKATIDDAVKDDENAAEEEKFLTTSGSGTSVKLAINFDKFLKTFTSKYVDETLLKYTVYYQSPRSTDFSSTSTKTGALADISLSDEGTYRFYVLISDGENNEITVKDLDERADGFYASKDASAELVVPIFEYNFVKAAADKAVSVVANGISAKNAKGRVNQRYQAVSFEVTNAAYEKYTLKYRANADSDWKDAKNGVDANFTQSSFTSSQIYFTPLKKGQFKVEARVKGNAEDLETKTAESSVITVSEKVEELKLVDEKVKNFFKNNWLSVLFLGIALLCLVGIVVIALWKPSDGKKTGKTAKEEEKAEETTVAADEPAEIASGEKNADEENAGTAEETTESTENAETAEETTESAENAEIAEETTESADNAGENAQTTEERVESAEVTQTPAETTGETNQSTENGETSDGDKN